jgi:hypothetical protein
MSLWGHLAERYENTERPRALLALDGGGIRGAMTLEVLAEIERQLAEATGRGEDFRLAHFFDYVAGTSTGAIIAAGIARGMSIAELLDFYTVAGPLMFEKEKLLKRLRSLYTADPLKQKLQEVFGPDTTLSPEHLKTLLLVVTRNATTDSPWPISTNPHARYNRPDRSDCNLKIPLWQLVRASTAAPIFFPPEVVPWDPDDPNKTFVFVDGGITPYNDPAFLLFRMATAPQYALSWPTGERKMMLVSVGTGSAPTLDGDVLSPGKNALSNLAGLPGALMYGAQVDQDVNCRFIGRCVHGAPIDRELGDMKIREGEKVVPVTEDRGRAFLYARYDADLTEEGLEELGLGGIDPKAVQTLDAVDALGDLRRIGEAVAEGVEMERDFGPFLDAWRASARGGTR